MSTANAYFGNGIALGADSDLDAVAAIEVDREDRYLAVQVIIDNGAGGAPTDLPIGVLELHCTGNGKDYSPVTGTLITAELAKVASNGNVLVSGWAILEGVPGTAKLKYKRSSGGTIGSGARLRAFVTT